MCLCRQVNGWGDLWDPFKCVELRRPFWYASFGAELRGSYEVYRDYNWGSGPQDRNGYYLNRLIGHADFHLGQSARIFAELQSGLEFGRNGGPRPSIDEDKLDLSQLFLELRPSTRQDRVPIAARVGRQDFNYGDGSLVSLRDLNVRRPFDGIEIGRKQIRIFHVSFQFQESTTIINDLSKSCNFRHSQYSLESAARYPGTAIPEVWFQDPRPA